MAPTDEHADARELWKAEQCGHLIAGMATIRLANPLTLNGVVRACCGQTNAGVNLAHRVGVPKPVLSRWLCTAEARLSLSILLDRAASEGFSLERLLTAAQALRN